VRLDEAGPHSPDVGGCADEEEQDDDHAVETEEGALNSSTITITWKANQIYNKYSNLIA
jgi:hypothetical protein